MDTTGGTTGDADFYCLDDLTVNQVSEHCWRVSDSRVADGSPRHLLGFVDRRTEGVFEVMQLGQGFHWTTFVSLDEALSHLRTTGPDLSQQRSEGKLSWVR